MAVNFRILSALRYGSGEASNKTHEMGGSAVRHLPFEPGARLEITDANFPNVAKCFIGATLVVKEYNESKLSYRVEIRRKGGNKPILCNITHTSKDGTRVRPDRAALGAAMCSALTAKWADVKYQKMTVTPTEVRVVPPRGGEGQLLAAETIISAATQTKLMGKGVANAPYSALKLMTGTLQRLMGNDGSVELEKPALFGLVCETDTHKLHDPVDKFSAVEAHQGAILRHAWALRHFADATGNVSGDRSCLPEPPPPSVPTSAVGSPPPAISQMLGELGPKKDLCGTLTDLRSTIRKYEPNLSSKQATKKAKTLLKHTRRLYVDSQKVVTKKFRTFVVRADSTSTQTTSIIMPANQFAVGQNSLINTTMQSYGEGIVSSQSNRLSRSGRAGNNQMSELVHQGEVIFRGVRHAIVANDAGDAAVNKQKALDIVRSAIFQKLASLELADTPLAQLTLNLTSISLVTPDGLRGMFGTQSERSMLEQQRAAFAAVQNLTAEEKAALLAEFKIQIGTISRPCFAENCDLRISTTPFNFGVNEGERLGRAHQAKQNNDAFEQLDAKLAAKRRQYLRNFTADSLEVRTLDALRDALDAARSEFAAAGMFQNNPYKLPVLVAAVSIMLGESLAFNCMSGKDRTGMFDVFIKRFISDFHEALREGDIAAVRDALQFFEKTDPETQAKNLAMAKHSGNFEVQMENTTGAGYKLESKLGKIKTGNTDRWMKNAFGIADPLELQLASSKFSA